MSFVIFAVAIVLVVAGSLGAAFNGKIDLWMRTSGSRVFPDSFRNLFESGFGDPAEGRTALKVSIGFLSIGVIMLFFGPVVS